ncbi:hypothetical protein V8C86DRAFT_39933 [Haematococcus lacustris]
MYVNRLMLVVVTCWVCVCIQYIVLLPVQCLGQECTSVGFCSLAGSCVLGLSRMVVLAEMSQLVDACVNSDDALRRAGCVGVKGWLVIEQGCNMTLAGYTLCVVKAM